MIPWPEANLLRILHRDSVKEIENLSKEQLSRRFEPGSQTLLMLAAASGANAVIGFLRSTVPTGLDPLWWTSPERWVRCPQWQTHTADDRVGDSRVNSSSRLSA